MRKKWQIIRKNEKNKKICVIIAIKKYMIFYKKLMTIVREIRREKDNMKKQRKLGKRVLSILLCMSLTMSGLIVPTKQVRAVETQAEENTGNTKTIAGLGTSVIVDPTAPANDTDAWKGSYVYYGNYNSSPVKYRVLDASTTDYSADGTTQTMLLDCDSILYYQKFDEDGTANEDGKKANDWSISDVKNSLNGDGFLNKAGVFTSAEKNAIAASTVDSHELTTDSETGVNVASWTQSAFANYVALTGEQIFLLDAEDVSNGVYGYSMTDSGCENRKKTGSSAADWWLRSACSDSGYNVGYVYDDDGGYITLSNDVNDNSPGVSPSLNLNLSSVLFSSVISGTAGETGAEYKLTLLDGDMTIAASGDVTRNGKTVTVPYSISGANSANATQVSVLILDKEYTVGNTNGATVLDYQKINVDSFLASGKGTYTLPDSLANERMGLDYYAYIVAEDVNGEKETDYASTPVAIPWATPISKQMNFGTQGIIDPAVPNSASDAWKGCYVYYGNYDANGDGTAEPVKYRVLDASTTDFSADGMFLDCDSILYYTPFDEEEPYRNVWKDSTIYTSLNGDGFLNKDGVFTTAEKNAIATSNVDTHPLTTDSETGVNVASWTQSNFANYVALTGEQIFLLDAEDVSNGAYGYSMMNEDTENRKKTGRSATHWWLRSACSGSVYNAGYVDDCGYFDDNGVYFESPGVSPALNLNLSSVLFSSANTVSKSSALTSGSAEIGTEANTDWKLTLKDTEKSVKLTEGRSVTKASDGTITVPYTYKDKENVTDSEKVNQISVMITDKAYDAEKVENAQEAQILYYGALQDIKDAEGNGSTVTETSSGTGTFALPSGLTEKTQGEDYHIYLLAEHVNDDNATDYASEPLKVEVKTLIDTANVPSIDAPTAEQPLQTEITVSSEGVAEKATLTWKKDDTEATGNAQWKTTYQAYVTLTAAKGYTFMDATGNRPSVTLNGQPVDAKDITWNKDGTTTVYCGKYTTKTRKIKSVTAPEVPTQFVNDYTADNVLSSTELGTTAKVTLEGTTQPNPKEMEVEWSLANENDAPYNATPAATNTFKWTVNASEYADYDLNGVTMEGIVTLQNIAHQACTHTWDEGVVTKEATVTEKGEKTYTCSVCKTTKKEEIPVLGALEVGTKKTSDDGKATYKVTTSDFTNGTVTYVAPTNKKATTVTIPDTVTVDGVTYKVTTIEKNAFKNNKKIKKVTIGKNVKTIGKNAFSGCKKVTSITIGKNVTTIGEKAFYGCSKVKTLTINSSKLTAKKIGSKAFTKTPKSMKVTVPKKQFKTYKSMLIKRGVNKNAKFKKK